MDLFTYSYPCKNISIAGKGAGLEKDSGTQSSLVWDCFKIIEYHKPKYLLMENVKNLVGKKHKPQFDLICEELEKIGYNNYWKVLDGKDFGVPQQRERVMMISIRKDIDDNTFEMPKGYPLTKTVRDILQDDVDDYLYKNKKYEFVNQKRVVAKFIDGNFDQAKRIYKIDSYSPTICVKYDTLNILLDDGKVRILSPLECWRLMGIKDEDFYKVESTVDGKTFVTARGWEDLSQLLYAYEQLGKTADREVVGQYIQHWKTAKDFANYLELFEKYKFLWLYIRPIPFY